MADGIGYYNGLLGKLFDNGTALPLRGGLNFVGFDIVQSSEGYTITANASGGAAASDVTNDSSVSGATVKDALNSNLAAIATNTTNIAAASAAAASAGTAPGSTGSVTYNSGGGTRAGSSWTTDGFAFTLAQATASPNVFTLSAKSFTGLTGGMSCRIQTWTITGTFSYATGAYSGTQAIFNRWRQPAIAGDAATATFTGQQAIMSFQGPPTQGTFASLENPCVIWEESGGAFFRSGSAPARSGVMGFSKSSTLWAVRNAAGSADLPLCAVDGSDVATWGTAGLSSDFVGLRYLNGARLAPPTQAVLVSGSNAVNMTTAANYWMPASTTATASTVTCGATGAATGACLSFYIQAQGHTVTIQDASGTTLRTVSAGEKEIVDMRWDTSTSKYANPSWKKAQ